MKLFRTQMKDFLKRKGTSSVLTNVTKEGYRIVFLYGGRYLSRKKENHLEVEFQYAWFEKLNGTLKDDTLIVFPDEELRDATKEEVELLNSKCNED